MKNIYDSVLRWFCLYLAMSMVTGLENCQLTLDKCMHNMHELQEKVSSLETLQSRAEQRVAAITQEVMSEMTRVSKDMGSTKTVINRLVDDTVQIQGHVDTFQEIGEDVKGLHKQVSSARDDLEGKLANVNRRLESVDDNLHKQADANRQITVLMSSQMSQNQKMLTDTQHAVEQHSSKLGKLESKVLDMKAEVFAELSGRIDKMETQYREQINALKEEIAAARNANAQLQ